VWYHTNAIPATQEVDRIAVWGQPATKVTKIISLRTSWAWWCTPTIPITQKAEIEDCGLRLAQAKAQDPIWKITKAKRAGGMAQVVECLLSKIRKLVLPSEVCNPDYPFCYLRQPPLHCLIWFCPTIWKQSCWADLLLLEPHLHSMLLWLCWRWGFLMNYLPGLASWSSWS
jgi:hypothetical protein